MPQLQFPLIRLLFLHQEAHGRKQQMLRLLPHDEMQQDGDGHEKQAAEKKRMNEGHKTMYFPRRIR